MKVLPSCCLFNLSKTDPSSGDAELGDLAFLVLAPGDLDHGFDKGRRCMPERSASCILAAMYVEVVALEAGDQVACWRSYGVPIGNVIIEGFAGVIGSRGICITSPAVTGLLHAW